MILEETKFYYNATVEDGDVKAAVLDLAKLASSRNRKHIPNVDRQGNAQMFLCKVKVITATNCSTQLATAPNLYTTKAAVKAWHDARVKMITRGGVKMSDLGPYARHLRPFLNVNHENGTTVEIDTETSVLQGLTFSTQFQGDEYTRTRLAVSTPAENTDTASIGGLREMVDTYSLTLCDASVAESTTVDDPDESHTASDEHSFVSVGMIDSWLSSIFKAPLATSDSLRIQADNPLIQLRIDSPSSEEVIEIVEDSASEGRPWDLDGSAYTALSTQAYWHTNVNQSQEVLLQVPCGLLYIHQKNDHSADEAIVTEIEILDVYDM